LKIKDVFIFSLLFTDIHKTLNQNKTIAQTFYLMQYIELKPVLH